MVARLKQVKKARPTNTSQTSTPQAITHDKTTTAGPSNHGPKVPNHTRPIPMSVDIPPNRPTVPASHNGMQPVPTSTDTGQRQQNPAASEPSTDILDTVRNIRRKHRRTNINTVLVLDEVGSSKCAVSHS